MDSLLNLKNVNLKYQTGNDTIKVLKNINLETKKNESISIVGESGSGKTSLAIHKFLKELNNFKNPIFIFFFFALMQKSYSSK